MTLKSRNRIVFLLFIVSVAVLVFSTTFFIHSYINGEVSYSATPYKVYDIFDNSPLFQNDLKWSIFAIFSFMIYVPTTFLIIYLGFEKTQSLEIIYFIFFLVACLMETVKIYLPIDGLWNTSSHLLLFTGRVVVMGRILAPLSLLFAAFFGENEQRENVERNILILILVSIFTGIIIPLDSYQVTTSCTVLWSYRKSFHIVRVILSLLTFLVILLQGFEKDSQNLKNCSFFYTILITGYAILCATDCSFLLFAGAGLLTLGSVLYLRSIHSMYLWR